jgi:hypothetical protein
MSVKRGVDSVGRVVNVGRTVGTSNRVGFNVGVAGRSVGAFNNVGRTVTEASGRDVGASPVDGAKVNNGKDSVGATELAELD